MGKYDYSKFKDPDWSDDWVYKEHKFIDGDASEEDDEKLEDTPPWPESEESFNKEYWGIHEVDGRLEIDLRRFEYVCNRMTEHDYFPKQLLGKNGYYIASKEHRTDYTINYLMDSIDWLRKDWNEEFKPLFKKIRTPGKAEDDYRMATIPYFDSEFYDDILLGARHAALKRSYTYNRIITELECVFITKIVIEIHRIILRALSMIMYEKQDYSVWDLVTYCNGRGVSFYSLSNWKTYLKYNSVYNFLKHNSVASFETLRKYNPECLIDPNEEYENGMFSAYCLNLKEANVDQLLKDIVPFLKDFCTKVLNEDLD